MIEKDTSGWFHDGRGNVSVKVAKSSQEIANLESAQLQGGMEAVTGDAGAKPVFATGASPFHTGRGSGRGNS